MWSAGEGSSPSRSTADKKSPLLASSGDFIILLLTHFAAAAKEHSDRCKSDEHVHDALQHWGYASQE